MLPEPEELTTVAQFHTTIKQLDLVIKAVIKKHVPMSKHSPHSKRWWSKELAELKKKKEKLARKSYERWVVDGDPIHKTFHQARNDYLMAICEAKANHGQSG